MDPARFKLFTDKDLAPGELAGLMASVGWGSEAAYNEEDIRRSIASYPFVAHVRDRDGSLVGYTSAFSDSVYSVFVGELVVHPEVQGHGIGKALLQTIESTFSGVPVYVKTFVDQKAFFLKQGYAPPRRQMCVLSKRNEANG